MRLIKAGLLALVAALVLGGGSALLALRAPGAEPSPAACVTEAGPGRVFHIDAADGGAQGDGSAARPWHGLAGLVAAQRLGATRLTPSLAGRVVRRLTGRVVLLVPQANRDPLVSDGDTVLLGDGDYGAIDLSGIRNRRLVTIAAAPGARPRLRSLRLEGAANFRFRGLTVRDGLRRPGDGSLEFLVHARQAGRWVPRDLHFEDMTIGTGVPIRSVARATWAAGGRSGIEMRGDCLSISNSRIHDVRFGIGLFKADRARAEGNSVTGFSIDGIDFSGNDIAITGNAIADHRMTGDAYHPDCMQGQAGPGDPPFRGVRIEGNVCVARVDAAVEVDEYMQGISIFDGAWRDVRVRCNLVLATAAHGIALYGADDAEIAGNVVLAAAPAKPSWILAFPGAGGRAPQGNRIHDNLATAYPNAAQGGASPPGEVLRRLVTNGDRAILDPLLAGFGGVVLGRNRVVLPALQPADARLSGVRLAVPPGPMSAAEARARYPLPAACRS